jgi:hypothetical protein
MLLFLPIRQSFWERLTCELKVRAQTPTATSTWLLTKRSTNTFTQARPQCQSNIQKTQLSQFGELIAN